MKLSEAYLKYKLTEGVGQDLNGANNQDLETQASKTFDMTDEKSLWKFCWEKCNNLFKGDNKHSINFPNKNFCILINDFAYHGGVHSYCIDFNFSYTPKLILVPDDFLYRENFFTNLRNPYKMNFPDDKITVDDYKFEVYTINIRFTKRFSLSRISVVENNGDSWDYTGNPIRFDDLNDKGKKKISQALLNVLL